MSLREAARQAWLETARESSADARAVLAERLAPFDTGLLDLTHFEVAPSHTLAVFTDGDIAVAVRRKRGQTEWTVELVTRDRRGWSTGPDVKSLEHLWELLAGRR